MKTHLKTLIITVGIIVAVILISFVVYTWPKVIAAIFGAIAILGIYMIVYCEIEDYELQKRIDQIDEEEWNRLCNRVTAAAEDEPATDSPEGEH